MHVKEVTSLALSISFLSLGVAQVYCSIWAPARVKTWRWGKRGTGAPASETSAFLCGIFFMLVGGIGLFEDREIRVLRFSWPLLIIVFALLGWSGWKDNHKM